jgi:hypothetical protein
VLSQELTETRQYKAFVEILRTGQVSNDPPGTQVMIVLMLMEIVASLDAIMETIARHE